ncbi:hypothetical protein LTR37_003252 [Vermiconidia calcicola]|uniref:Uncharacterized protein n=1 Tax=Vermiconidia calcicola TaxID=1690605 RepID=A0ACC3NR14_9PEZI|nr:hypothetical protein LTR37_003252 [Vermiconidia calcicola]
MTTPMPDDELLSILLVNLRNAASTFGEGSPPYEGIRTTVEEHVQAMRAKGNSTDITSVRQTEQLASSTSNVESVKPEPSFKGQNPMSFSNLAFRPKTTG